MSEKEDALAAVILALMPEKGVAHAQAYDYARAYAHAQAYDYARAYAHAHAHAHAHAYARARVRAYAQAYDYAPFTEGQKAQIDTAYTLLFT